jgi:uncharacterized protein (TIGR03437 family)
MLNRTIHHKQLVSIALALAILMSGAVFPAYSLQQATAINQTQASADAPSIIFTSVPPYGSFALLKGQARNVNPTDYRVAVFIFIPDLGWWTKPTCASPLTTIQSDGTWSTSITTGGVDETATQIAAYVVPASFSQACVLGVDALPARLEQQAVARIIVARENPNQRVVRFSGHEWFVKASRLPVFPGPNYFSDSSDNVSVDDQGRLHLRLTKRSGSWYSAEVYSRSTFGYGTYRFYLESAVDKLDPNLVLGLFTYSVDPAFGHRELDVEFSRFGNPNNMNAQYVIQPFTNPLNIHRFQMPSMLGASVHSFDWKRDRVVFQSWSGSNPTPPDQNSIIQQWTYSQDSVPQTADEKVHLNLWTINPPSDGMEQEIIIRKFEFVPASPSVTSVSAASFTGERLASESIASAFGSSLATTTLVANTIPLPTSLGGTTIKIKDSAGTERLAPLFFVSPTQVNYQVPPGTVTGTATVTVTSGDGTVSTGTAQIASVAPGLFTANASGQGVAAAVALRVKADGSQSAEPIAQFDVAQNKFIAIPIDLGPASDQVFLILFGTGIRFRSSLSAVSVKIGGADAQVYYAGAQGNFVGLDQVNVLLARSLSGRGEVDVELTVDGQAANTIKVNIK